MAETTFIISYLFYNRVCEIALRFITCYKDLLMQWFEFGTTSKANLVFDKITYGYFTYS